jgi:hypothetical protein
MQSSAIKPTVLFLLTPRVYILENTPPPREWEYQLMSFGGKNMKRGREKDGKC